MRSEKVPCFVPLEQDHVQPKIDVPVFASTALVGLYYNSPSSKLAPHPGVNKIPRCDFRNNELIQNVLLPHVWASLSLIVYRQVNYSSNSLTRFPSRLLLTKEVKDERSW